MLLKTVRILQHPFADTLCLVFPFSWHSIELCLSLQDYYVRWIVNENNAFYSWVTQCILKPNGYSCYGKRKAGLLYSARGPRIKRWWESGAKPPEVRDKSRKYNWKVIKYSCALKLNSSRRQKLGHNYKNTLQKLQKYKNIRKSTTTKVLIP